MTLTLLASFNIQFHSTVALTTPYLNWWRGFITGDVIEGFSWLVLHAALFCLWTWWIFALVESARWRAWLMFLNLRLEYWRWRTLRKLQYLRRLDSFHRSILRGDWDDAFAYSERQRSGGNGETEGIQRNDKELESCVCPICGSNVRVPREHIGKRGRCSNCEEIFEARLPE